MLPIYAERNLLLLSTGSANFCFKGLPVGFLLLRYSVLCTVESLSLLLISGFICLWRLCIDKLGVFRANLTSMCLEPRLNLG